MCFMCIGIYMYSAAVYLYTYVFIYMCKIKYLSPGNLHILAVFIIPRRCGRQNERWEKKMRFFGYSHVIPKTCQSKFYICIMWKHANSGINITTIYEFLRLPKICGSHVGLYIFARREQREIRVKVLLN